MSKRSQYQRQGKNAAAGIAVLAVIAMATTAHAQRIVGPDPSLPTVPISGDVFESTSGFDVLVQGDIPARCELGEGAEHNFGELRGNLSFNTAVHLKCNVPFDLKISAAFGGLAHNVMPNGQGPFSGRLAYALAVEVPVIDPAPRTIFKTYQSQELLGGATLSSDQGIADGQAQLKFRTGQPEGAGLLAGEYSETISLVLVPRM